MTLLSIMMCKDLASVGAIKNKLTNYSKCFVLKNGVGGPTAKCLFLDVSLKASP